MQTSKPSSNCPSPNLPHSPSNHLQASFKSSFSVLPHRIQRRLGSGHFGTVYKGFWKCPRGEEEVAIKLLQSGASDEDRVKFLQEAAIMGQFRHPNVVKLHGVVTLGDPVRPLSLALSLSLSHTHTHTHTHTNTHSLFF